ncbi:hypothetical protein CGRA01v4_13404 [Colletotrichum graminicola]|nr:hypothetical protein CGRA01v4_13404 [Colletotrichum graminicola]
MWCHHAHKTYQDRPCRRRRHLPSVNQSNPPPHSSLSRTTSSTDQRSKEPRPPHPAPGATPHHAHLKPVSPARPPTHAILLNLPHPSIHVREAANHSVQSITPLSSPATAATGPDRATQSPGPLRPPHPSTYEPKKPASRSGPASRARQGERNP